MDDGDGAAKVPGDFGSEGGTEISNKDSVFADIDRVLGRGKPPALEYILVSPAATFRIPFTDYGLYYNSYGHAALRYNYQGRDIIMNITGKKIDARMVQFTTPGEFLYGTNYGDTALWDQKGCYNRNMFGVRVEELPAENIERMHRYFTELEKREDASFNIIFSPVVNAFRYLFPGISEAGNCARWTSEGLMRSGVVTNPSLWPKSIFINIFENAAHTAAGSSSNINVVSYRRVRHANRSYGVDASGIEAVAPLQSLRSFAYLNLEWFANAIVEVPSGSTKAKVLKQDNACGPSRLRNYINSFGVIAVSVLVTGLLVRKNTRALTTRIAQRYWPRGRFKRRADDGAGS